MIQLKKILLLISITMLSECLFAQVIQSIDFEELPALQAENPRPALIYLTADWCTFCKQVENTSFKSQEIINKLNRDFYFIEFNIEERKDIRLGTRTYSFKPTGVDTGVHELAELLGTIEGVLSTPTFIILSSSNEMLYRYGGFLSKKEIKTMLKEASLTKPVP